MDAEAPPGAPARRPRAGPLEPGPGRGRHDRTDAARRALHDGSRPSGAAEGSVERLLLVFEELVSNALRHGRPPIEVMVTATGHRWLLEVTDAAGASRRAQTAAGPRARRVGLALIPQISGAYGWEPLNDGRKVVWAQVDYTYEGGSAHDPRVGVGRLDVGQLLDEGERQRDRLGPAVAGRLAEMLGAREVHLLIADFSGGL